MSLYGGVGLARLLGVACALGAALLYSTGASLQALEARRAAPEDALRTTLLRHLIVRPVWLGGTLCVFGGWLLQTSSLTTVPVTVVQPILALGLIALIVIGSRLLGEDVGRREVLATVAIIVGVVGLVLLGPSQSRDQASPAVLALVIGGLALFALVPYALRSTKPQLVLIVLSAGLSFALCGIANSLLGKAFGEGRWGWLAVWLGVIVAGAVVALVGEMTAFQRAPVTHAFPVILVTQIVVAVGLAPVLGGESWNGAPLAVVGMAASLAVIIVGAALLVGTSAVGAPLQTESQT
jgi:drug/metabolite transporter (DMT)-like permease